MEKTTMPHKEICQFNDTFRRNGKCTKRAHRKVVWTLWPLI